MKFQLILNGHKRVTVNSTELRQLITYLRANGAEKKTNHTSATKSLVLNTVKGFESLQIIKVEK